QVSGRRLRLAGAYGVTTANVLYGIFTSQDRSKGIDKAPEAIPPQPFCCRYAVAGANLLQIRDINSCCFSEKAGNLLQRDYHRVQDDSPGRAGFPTRPLIE